ncbi:hypothetical protein [Kaistia terrae]|uniref:Uncharacterized protein n=1 Tax=Kaistia terrae TaxID=537017 RepID=A0ABW0Q952_9HYPH|nr:hypothetical protein [Kaistia terrae]MCX5581205.1 hypothetical protein [Kaistia terrae]
MDQLGGAIVPPWDFADTSPDAPLDTSATAIMTAGPLDLARLHPDPAARQKWQQTAERLLTGLCTDYLATSPEHRGLLTKGCYSKPHNIGVQWPVMFGDYFFVEALVRIMMPGTFSIQHNQLAV